MSFWVNTKLFFQFQIFSNIFQILVWKLIVGNIFVKFIFVKIFQKYFSWKCSCQKYFYQKYFCQKYFYQKYFCQKYFSLPPLIVLHLYTAPIPSYLLFEVEGGGTNGGRTYGPDGAMFIPFIYTDYISRSRYSDIYS